MKLVLLPLLVLSLSGCSIFSVSSSFPEAPAELLVNCESLDKVAADEAKLSNILSTVTTNYSKYHECSAKVDSWIEWYTEQKKISDGK